MNVVLGSAFRNASRGYVERYMTQASLLREALSPHSLRVHAVEGDSINRTAELILAVADECGLPCSLTTHNHGGPIFASTELPERMAALSGVGNAILKGVDVTDDVLVYVESDLHWKADTIVRLVRQVAVGRDIIAPLVMAGENFYDVWAYRVNGTRFGPFPPFYEKLRLDEPTPIDSAGSCLVMRADVARKVRMTNGALVEFCTNARAAGYRVFCDARERINHP